MKFRKAAMRFMLGSVDDGGLARAVRCASLDAG